MATENNLQRVSYVAGEDLSSDQYRLVVQSGEFNVVRPNSSSDFAIGVLQNKPESGEAASVMVDGFSKIVAGEALAVGNAVKVEFVDAADAGKAHVKDDGEGHHIGVITSAAAAEDDLATIKIMRQGR